MATETLDSIKDRISLLSPSEKMALAAYLLEDSKPKRNGLKATSDAVLRHKRQAWIRANRSRYGGLYVALDGDQLLATGNSFAEAREAAADQDVFIDFVPPLDYIGETGGWD